MMIDPRAKLLAVLDHAEEYRGLALRAKERGEREAYARIVELYVEIAEELEGLMDRSPFLCFDPQNTTAPKIIDRRGCWDNIAVTKVGGRTYPVGPRSDPGPYL
jgi:hypothetical protein